MANLNIHPAPGLGDLTQGFFIVPQNPLQMANEGISRVPSLGEFMAGSFVVPQNPFWAYSAGEVQPLGQGVAGTPLAALEGLGYRYRVGPNARPRHLGSLGAGHAGVGPTARHHHLSGVGCADGGGCGCGGSCGGGMGALDLSSITNLAQEDSLGLGVPNWVYAAVAAGAYMFLFAGSTGSSRVGRARKAYRAYAA
jgi:hypothetical protein